MRAEDYNSLKSASPTQCVNHILIRFNECMGQLCIVWRNLCAYFVIESKELIESWNRIAPSNGSERRSQRRSEWLRTWSLRINEDN